MPAILALLTALVPLLTQAVQAIAAQVSGAKGPSPAEVLAGLQAAHTALGDAIAQLEGDLAKDDAQIDKEIKDGKVES